MHSLVPSPALLSTQASPRHSNHFIGSRSNNAYNTKSYLLLTISSINLNEPICTILPISKLLVQIAPTTTYLFIHPSPSSLYYLIISSAILPFLCNSLPIKLRSFWQLPPSATISVHSLTPLPFTSPSLAFNSSITLRHTSSLFLTFNRSAPLYVYTQHMSEHLRIPKSHWFLRCLYKMFYLLFYFLICMWYNNISMYLHLTLHDCQR